MQKRVENLEKELAETKGSEQGSGLAFMVRLPPKH